MTNSRPDLLKRFGVSNDQAFKLYTPEGVLGMTDEWLAASNFERTQKVLSAINTLSIHAKLTLGTICAPAAPSDIEPARQLVTRFLAQIQAPLGTAASEDNQMVYGTAPHLSGPARHFLNGANPRRH